MKERFIPKDSVKFLPEGRIQEIAMNMSSLFSFGPP